MFGTNYNNNDITNYRSAEEINSAMGRVYGHMSIAVLVSMLISYWIGTTPGLSQGLGNSVGGIWITDGFNNIIGGPAMNNRPAGWGAFSVAPEKVGQLKLPPAGGCSVWSGEGTRLPVLSSASRVW